MSKNNKVLLLLFMAVVIFIFVYYLSYYMNTTAFQKNSTTIIVSLFQTFLALFGSYLFAKILDIKSSKYHEFNEKINDIGRDGCRAADAICEQIKPISTGITTLLHSLKATNHKGNNLSTEVGMLETLSTQLEALDVNVDHLLIRMIEDKTEVTCEDSDED